MPGSSGTAISSPVDRGGHRVVARRGVVRIRHADHLAELHRELDRPPRARQPLDLVRVEQLVAGTPGEDEVELPGEVGGVAQSGAHPLAGERRHLVGGVAGEERPSGAPARGVPGLERVHRVALQPGVARMHVPRREQLPRSGLVVELVERLVGEPHELPAAATGAARHRGGRPRRIADLHVDRIEHAGLVEDDVDDQPVVEEAEIDDVDAGEPADGAVGTVAADHVASSDTRSPTASPTTTWSPSGSTLVTSTPRRTSTVGQRPGALVEERLERRAGRTSTMPATPTGSRRSARTAAA